MQKGRSALMAAVQGGNEKVVGVLLNLETKHLCDTNIQDEVPSRVLMYSWYCTYILIDSCKGRKGHVTVYIHNVYGEILVRRPFHIWLSGITI